MSQNGINVPEGIPVKSLDEVPEAAKKLADADGEVRMLEDGEIFSLTFLPAWSYFGPRPLHRTTS